MQAIVNVTDLLKISKLLELAFKGKEMRQLVIDLAGTCKSLEDSNTQYSYDVYKMNHGLREHQGCVDVSHQDGDEAWSYDGDGGEFVRLD